MHTEELPIEVVCRHLPGIRFEDQNPGGIAYEPVYIGIQRGGDVIEAVPGNRKQVIFRPTFKIGRQPDGSPNFLGPFAKGTPQQRFFYLSWGVMHEHGRFEMFRRAKIHLNHLTWEHIRRAASGKRPIKLIISDMTGRDGGPLCGSVKAHQLNWEL